MDDLTFVSNAMMTAIFFGLLFRAFREDWENEKRKVKKWQ